MGNILNGLSKSLTLRLTASVQRQASTKLKAVLMVEGLPLSL